jgi:hypothetical protein
MSLQHLYRKIDELNSNNYFELSPYYDQLISLPNGLARNLEKSQRSKSLKSWIEKKTNNQGYQTFILENIIIDLNHQVIQVFDDLCVYLIFFQYDSIMNLHLEETPQNISLGAWWSSPDLDALLIRSTKLDQCYLPARFSMTKVQDSPPLYKYLFNHNLYHTFWEPLEIYINQLEDLLRNTFRTSDVHQNAPIARFCIFNNPSLREYLAKYINCTKDKCSNNISQLDESEKCGQLNLKYQELLSLKQKYKCLYNSKTSANPKQKKEEFLTLENDAEFELTPKMDEDDIKINQMMGFGKVVLFDIVQYAIKLHKCQTNNIKIRDCQDLDMHVDIDDQPTDQNLGKVEIDRQVDMYSTYDQQLDQYHKLLHNQEVKKLTPLNILANKDHKEKAIKVNLLRDTANDFHSIITDLTNLPSQITKNNTEDFNNLLEDNQDLNESSFDDYKNKLEKQLNEYNLNNFGNIFSNTKKISFTIWNILTKDGRMMTSGFIIMIIALAFYFIDISS